MGLSLLLLDTSDYDDIRNIMFWVLKCFIILSDPISQWDHNDVQIECILITGPPVSIPIFFYFPGSNIRCCYDFESGAILNKDAVHLCLNSQIGFYTYGFLYRYLMVRINLFFTLSF